MGERIIHYLLISSHPLWSSEPWRIHQSRLVHPSPPVRNGMCRTDPHLRIHPMPLEFLRNHSHLPVLPPGISPCLISTLAFIQLFPSTTSLDGLGMRFGKARWAGSALCRGDGVWDGRNPLWNLLLRESVLQRAGNEPGCPSGSGRNAKNTRSSGSEG